MRSSFFEMRTFCDGKEQRNENRKDSNNFSPRRWSEQMNMRQNNDSLIDFGGDVNTQLCTIAKFAKAESVCVANTIRTIANSHNRKSVANP